MKTSEQIDKIAPALVKAVAAIKGAPRDGTNNAFDKQAKTPNYATLASCIEAAREALAGQGLCIIQAPGEVGEKTLIVTTRILHETGQWIESDFHMPLAQWTPQAAGSATTYARRYGLMAALSMAPIEDDDGNAASQGKASGKAPDGPITRAQADALLAVLDEAGADVSRFCAFMHVEQIGELPAMKFDAAMAAAKAKLRKSNGSAPVQAVQ